MNIDSMVIESYNAQIPLLLAKRTAALATKKVIQKQLDREKKGLGSLLYLGMTLMEQADLRQWSSLPKAFEIIRIKLKPGKYNYSIIPQLGRVQVSASFDQGEIDLKAGESKIFLYRNF
jgi:hypothetical protein